MEYTYTTTDPSDGAVRSAVTNDFSTALQLEERLIANDSKRTAVVLDKLKGIVFAMSEIRFALNFPSVAAEQSGLGEHPKLKPMFEEDEVAELRTKYIQLSTVVINLVGSGKQ
jgi:hypothetical protein